MHVRQHGLAEVVNHRVELRKRRYGAKAVLNQSVIHADETPVQTLAPGEKKTAPGLCLGLQHDAVLG